MGIFREIAEFFSRDRAPRPAKKETKTAEQLLLEVKAIVGMLSENAAEDHDADSQPRRMSRANAAAARLRALFLQLAESARKKPLSRESMDELAALVDATLGESDRVITSLNTKIATSEAVKILGLAQAIDSDNDELCDRVTELLVSAASIYRDGMASGADITAKKNPRGKRKKRRFPNPTRSGSFIVQLEELEQLRKRFRFFPKELFDQDSKIVVDSIRDARNSLESVKSLVLLLAEERRFARRATLLAEMKRWAEGRSAGIPEPVKRVEVIESQLQLINETMRGVDRGKKTLASLETLWKWFSQDFKFITTAVSLITVLGAYLGLNLNAIKEGYSAQIIQSIFAAIICLSAYILYWIWKARRHYSSPGLASLLVFAAMVPVIALTLVFASPGTWISRFLVFGPDNCVHVGTDVECLDKYKVLSDNGKQALLVPAESSTASPLRIVTSEKILLRSSKVIILSKDPQTPGIVDDKKCPPDRERHAEDGSMRIELERLWAQLNMVNSVLTRDYSARQGTLTVDLGKGFAAFGERVASLERTAVGAERQIDEVGKSIAQIEKIAIDTKLSVAGVNNMAISALERLQRTEGNSLLSYCLQRTQLSSSLRKKLVGAWQGYDLTEVDIKRCVDDWELSRVGGDRSADVPPSR